MYGICCAYLIGGYTSTCIATLIGTDMLVTGQYCINFSSTEDRIIGGLVECEVEGEEEPEMRNIIHAVPASSVRVFPRNIMSANDTIQPDSFRLVGTRRFPDALFDKSPEALLQRACVITAQNTLLLHMVGGLRLQGRHSHCFFIHGNDSDENDTRSDFHLRGGKLLGVFC